MPAEISCRARCRRLTSTAGSRHPQHRCRLPSGRPWAQHLRQSAPPSVHRSALPPGHRSALPPVHRLVLPSVRRSALPPGHRSALLWVLPAPSHRLVLLWVLPPSPWPRRPHMSPTCRSRIGLRPWDLRSDRRCRRASEMRHSRTVHADGRYSTHTNRVYQCNITSAALEPDGDAERQTHPIKTAAVTTGMYRTTYSRREPYSTHTSHPHPQSLCMRSSAASRDFWRLSRFFLVPTSIAPR